MEKQPTISVIISEYGRKRRVKRCLTCGKMYWKPKNMARSKYCSIECYKNRPPKPPLAKKCAICHRVFEKRKGMSLKRWYEEKKFCSMKCFTEAKRRGWYKHFEGKRHSAKSKKKMSAARKGRKCPWVSERLRGKPPVYTPFVLGHVPWNKGKPYLQIRGKRHWKWKGGKRRSLATIEYRQWRQAVFERDGFACTSCGKRGGDLEAHHIKPWAQYPSLRFVVDNGETLCVPCHARIDEYRKQTYGQQTS
jgi:5-methylcytosine-specific restriction endonuclease McrA